MLFYITGGAPQAVPGTACVEANRTACIEDTCSSGPSWSSLGTERRWSWLSVWLRSPRPPLSALVCFVKEFEPNLVVRRRIHPSLASCCLASRRTRTTHTASEPATRRRRSSREQSGRGKILASGDRMQLPPYSGHFFTRHI
jgi:hypothetical protein